MNKKVTGIVAYLSWIGWVIAYLAGDREGAKFHLNQALVLMVANLFNSVLAWIGISGFITGIIGFILLIFWILGIVYAIREEKKELPLLGGIRILG